MKKSIIHKIVLLTVLSLSVSCTKNFEEINTNPNAPEKIPLTNLLLSSISKGFNEALTIYTVAFGGWGPRPAGIWNQHFAETNCGLGWDIYRSSFPDFEFIWKAAYTDPFADLQNILSDPDCPNNMRSAALVLRAYLINYLVDLYGDIPFSQAGQINQFAQPVYDSQDSIYHSLNRQLKQASDTFNLSGDPLGRGDVLFYGDLLKWKKFANTLRIRILNRYKHLDTSARQELITMFSDPKAYPLFESNVDNASLEPVGSLPYIAPIYEWYILSPFYMLPSKTLVGILNKWNDPRLSFWLSPNANGDYIGFMNGGACPPFPTSVDITKYSSFSNALLKNPKLPMIAISYPELLFIKAELLDDKQAYMDGIEAALQIYNVNTTLTSRATADSMWQTNHLQAIMTQKWLLLFLNENEAYTEYRRTGYPSEIQEPVNSIFKGKGVPYRYAYPLIEGPTNGTNLQSAQSRQHIFPGFEIYGDKMWWAK